MKRFFIFLLLLLVSCTPWIQVGGLYTHESNYTVDLPQGWMKYNMSDDLIITRDGVLLQNVMITKKKIDDKFAYTKKKLAKDMLPQEVAEVLVDDYSSNSNLMNFEIIENTPAKISGQAGFKTVFKYKNRDGLRIKTICYGFLNGETLFTIRYTAAQRYYFEKDVQTFDRIKDSFKLQKS